MDTIMDITPSSVEDFTPPVAYQPHAVVTSGFKSTLTYEFDNERPPILDGFLADLEDTAWALNAMMRSYLAAILFKNLPPIPPEKDYVKRRIEESLVGNDYSYDKDVSDFLTGAAGRVRVRRIKNGFSLGFRLNDFALEPSNELFALAIGQYRYTAPESKILAQLLEIVGNVNSTFGTDILTNPSIDKTLSLSTIMSSGKFMDNKRVLEHDDFGGEPPDWNELFSSIQGVRLISAPLNEKDAIVRLGYDSETKGYRSASKYEECKTDADRIIFLEAILDRKISAYLQVEITDTDAEYLVQTPAKEINLSHLSFWGAQWFTYYQSKNNSECIKPVARIAQLNKVASKGSKLPPPRANEDGLVIDPDSNIYLIPAVDNVAQYEKFLSEFGATEGGDFCLIDELNPEASKAKKVKLPANILIYTDSINNKLVYTNTSGWETLLDLERCIPVNISHVARMLGSTVGSTSGAYLCAQIETILSKMNLHEVMRSEATANKAIYGEGFNPVTRDFDYDDLVWGLISNLKNGIQKMFRYFSNAGYYKWKNESGEVLSEKYNWMEEYSTENLSISMFSTNSPIPILRIIGWGLAEAYRLVQVDMDAYLSSRSVVSGLAEVALLKVFDKYASNFHEVQVEDALFRQVYTDTFLPETFKATDIPLTKDITFQPHQNRAFNYLKNSPPFAILAIDAGGGKTILALTDILYEMKKGHYKRPLVMCPSHLVKDYIKEANYVTGGRLNIIAITGATFKAWGEEKLEKLIKTAPINTIVVTDYNFIKGNTEEIVYGKEWLKVGRNAEFLRQFNFDAVIMDESHQLKNESQRTISTQRLVGEIPIKRLLSGTFVHDVLTDVVMQFNLMDPSVFGSRETFMDEFGLEFRGNKVLSWKPGAEAMVMQRMKQHCNVIVCKRKEWAALLPPIEESFYFEDLTVNQQSVYEAILQETLELLKAENPELLAQLNSGDESNSSELEMQLNPYLARLEQFLTAPTSDKAGEIALSDPKDTTSPKSKKVAQLVQEHIDKKIPGKILVFTSYRESARIIYESLPSELKEKAIHYLAENKFECASEFEKNPNKIVMIGVEKSMNTGLNLQYASRLIRVEAVWSPGDLEQGQARINRPNLKGKETRTKIYFDWVVCNRTIDITKIGRLTSKMVSNALFENDGNPLYRDLEAPSLIPMTLPNIMSHNDFATTLRDHLTAFQAYRQAEQKDFDNYRKDKSVDTRFVPIPDGEVLPGSALLRSVPYVAGMDLFGAENLGLVPYYEYLRINNLEDSDAVDLQVHTQWGDGVITRTSKRTLRVEYSDGSTDSVDKMAAFIITKDTTSTKDIKTQLAKLAGMPFQGVTQEVGKLYKVIDGVSIYKLSANAFYAEKGNVKYDIIANADLGIDKWVVSDANDKDVVMDPVRTLTMAINLAVKSINSKGTVVPTPTSPAPIKRLDVIDEVKPKAVKKPTPTVDLEQDNAIDLYISVINGGLAAIVDAEDPDAAMGGLKSYGFKKWSGPYIYCEVKSARHMRALIDTISSKFDVPENLLESLEETFELFTLGRSKLFNPDQASKVELVDFFRSKSKPSVGKELKVYPLIQDGVLYLCTSAAQPAASRLSQRVVISGVKWERDEGFYAAFFNDKTSLKSTLQNMTKDGITINNLADVKEEFRQLKLSKK